MKIVKPHFWYNKSQRNGVFFLLLIIVLLQVVYSFVDFSKNDYLLDDHEIRKLQAKIDSLKVVELKNRKPKIYPFNPNYITDYKGGQLGMSIKQIDRLLVFRKQNKYINSAKQFQSITKVSDSLLNKISPYFKFPNWVVSQSQNKTKNYSRKSSKKVSVKISTSDINLATSEDFETIEGVNEFLAKRIVKYRKRIKGFSYKNQLEEVWKIDANAVDQILRTFSIKTKPVIKKVNVNNASFKEVLSNPYIDYQLCKKIFEYRDEVAELQSIEELKNIQGFPLDKYDRIVLYLEAK